MHLSYLRLLLLITTVAVLLAGCGGGSQPSDTPTSEAKVIATASQMPSADPELDLRFRDAVEKFVKTSWSTWAPGEKIGQCFITNAGLMTKESKEAVIEHGIDEAFNKLS